MKTVIDTLNMDSEIAKLDYAGDTFRTDYARILNFIRYQVDQSDLKGAIVDFAKTQNLESEANQIPESSIRIEGSIAYCLNRGAKLNPDSEKKLIDFINSFSQTVEESTTEFQNLPDSAASKLVRAYVNCYSRIDNSRTLVIKNKLDIGDLPAMVRTIVNRYAQGKPVVIKRLLEHYKDLLSEASNDPDIASWIKPLGVTIRALDLIVNSRSNILSGDSKSKSRKLKVSRADFDPKGEKAAAKMVYKNDDANLGIASLNPTNVVGADVAVVYDSKLRRCTVYRASAGSKLSVQGAKITNFDPKTSVGKTLRKPEQDVLLWTRATTVKRLEVVMSSIKGKSWEGSGKLNRNTLILKVF